MAFQNTVSDLRRWRRSRPFTIKSIFDSDFSHTLWFMADLLPESWTVQRCTTNSFDDDRRESMTCTFLFISTIHQKWYVATPEAMKVFLSSVSFITHCNPDSSRLTQWNLLGTSRDGSISNSTDAGMNILVRITRQLMFSACSMKS
jgi:hypothetical protein